MAIFLRWKFARRGKAENVAWRHSGIVDNYSRRFDACFRRLRNDVIERRSGDFRNRGDIIQEREQSEAQRTYLLVTVRAIRS